MKTVVVLRSNPKDTGFLRVIKALADDYIVECLIWDREGNFSPSFVHPHVNYRRCGIRGGYHSLSTLFKVGIFNLWLVGMIIRISPCVVHAIDLDTGIAGYLASRFPARKLVYHCLDPYSQALPETWPRVLSRIAELIENFIIGRADLFVVTDFLRMPQHAGATPRRYIEFANVPTLEIADGAQATRSSFTVGYIGSLTEGRNLVTLIEAGGEMSEEGVALVIGGFGPCEADIVAKCSGYENVSFLGWVPHQEVLQIEASFDVLVHIMDSRVQANRWGSPNKLFESMALGKPILVGMDTIGADHVARVGNGIAVEYGSKEALKDAIIFLKNHPSIAKQMGMRGRHEFLSNWSFREMKQRLLNAYREC